MFLYTLQPSYDTCDIVASDKLALARRHDAVGVVPAAFKALSNFVLPSGSVALKFVKSSQVLKFIVCCAGYKLECATINVTENSNHLGQGLYL